MVNRQGPGGSFGPCGPCPDGKINPFGGPASSPFSFGGGIPGGFQSGQLGVVANPVGPIPPTPPAPPPVGPPAVNLATAAFFKILAKSGISNVPTSQVIGNMGVSPIGAAAITGFALVLDGSGQFSTSAQVTGRVFAADYSPPTPAMLTQAVLDMQNAYTDAAGRPANFTDVNAGDLGGLNLGGGVYKFSTGVIIPTNLTLTGGPSDTWIFQIPGTLVVGNGVQIILAGGAQASNVVWQVAGATTIGTTAQFNGTILDLTNIAVQTGAAVNGKLLAQTAVTLDSNVIDP